MVTIKQMTLLLGVSYSAVRDRLVREGFKPDRVEDRGHFRRYLYSDSTFERLRSKLKIKPIGKKGRPKLPKKGKK